MSVGMVNTVFSGSIPLLPPPPKKTLFLVLHYCCYSHFIDICLFCVYLMDFFWFFPHLRIRDCLTQLYAKDITPDDKQELDEALQREVMSWKLF